MASRPIRQQGPSQPFEDLTFHSCPDPTLGVELELQVLDPDTGDLAPGAQRILDACADEGIEGVTGEFLLSMLEVKTDICRNTAEVRDTLLPLIAQVRNIARSLGYELALGGTHPFARPLASAVSPDERFQHIRRQQGWLAYQENIFGLHFHVGVPGGDEAIGLINLLCPYLPHLLALSANSPFWEGVDTEFASIRSVLFRPAAHAGVPQHFASWGEFSHYCKVMHQGGAIQATKDLYWDIRPRPGIGTIEFRICDAPPTLATLLGLAALARCLVIEGLQTLRRHPSLRRGNPGNHWLAGENKWLAARYGLQAECVCLPGNESCILAEDTARLLDRLQPVARDAGEEGYLAAVHPQSFESGAERQRRIFRQAGSWQAVVDDLRTRWDGELEDRTSASTSMERPRVVSGRRDMGRTPNNLSMVPGEFGNGALASSRTLPFPSPEARRIAPVQVFPNNPRPVS